MPVFHSPTKTVRLKIVYYGPGMSGKTTNVRQLHQKLPVRMRGHLVALDTETERTLFFDYFPANLGRLGTHQLRVDAFSVPGQAFFGRTRHVVLDGADGIVFVADSSANRELANRQSLKDLQEALAAQGRNITSFPLVFQWNKRDVADALPINLMQRTLNVTGAPSHTAIAQDGIGVWETHRTVLRLTLAQLHAQRTPAPAHLTSLQGAG